jgi:hypothetical protein
VEVKICPGQAALLRGLKANRVRIVAVSPEFKVALVRAVGMEPRRDDRERRRAGGISELDHRFEHVEAAIAPVAVRDGSGKPVTVGCRREEVFDLRGRERRVLLQQEGDRPGYNRGRHARALQYLVHT